MVLIFIGTSSQVIGGHKVAALISLGAMISIVAITAQQPV